MKTMIKIQPGESWGIVGRNGSGKSTLATALAGEHGGSLVSFEAEDALLERELREDDSEFLDRIDYGRTVREMIEEVHSPGCDLNSLATGLGLSELLEQGFLTLSTGERRRLMLARALAQSTNLLVLDEPFDGLDQAFRQPLRDLLTGRDLIIVANRLSDLDAFDTEDEGLVYQTLLVIPGMTEAIIDAVLDALDSDSESRPGGAELADYESSGISNAIPDGPFDSIDQLLQVQGVTPALFYGEDANRNGLLDPNEDDGSDLPPTDNADGILGLEWLDYFTTSSREGETTPEGDAKINLNQGQMTELYDAVEAELGAEAADFIVGYRLAGTEYAQKAFDSPKVDVTDISRNGIDLTVVPAWQFTSVYELIGGTTNEVKMVSGSNETFESPWPNDATTLLSMLPQLEDLFTTTDDAWIEGRININQARNEVLQAIPLIPIDAPDTIVAARPPVSMQDSSSSAMSRRTSAAWLVVESIVDLETLRQIGPWITTGGDVFTVQSIGRYDEGGPSVRLEAMIDATEYPPKITFVRNLTHLGAAYPPSLFSVEEDE